MIRCIIVSILSFAFSGLISPPNNSSDINYTHILFEWEQLEDAKYYQIQISTDINFSTIITDSISESLIYIEKNNIDWETEYYWKIRALDQNHNDITPWIDTFTFSTGEKRSDAETIIYNTQEIQSGVTIFSSFFNYFTAMIDIDGNEIWNTANTNLVYYINDNYGQLYGTQFNISEDELPGIEFSIDNEIIWSETGDSYVHHDFFKLPNNHYLGIGEYHQNGPIPEDINPDVLLQFQMIGYPTYPTSDFFIFPWVGDEIIEWDQEGNIVWSWNTFDYLNFLEDYDLLGDLWLEAYLMGRHDWTHSNALWFNESDSSIYLSSRHLSRIIKIDYPSGDIIWQMGFNMPSGEVDCGHDLNFSFQHSLQVLDNGNILILDNGNNSQDIYGTEHPTTRALEIEVTETNNGCEANIVWEYALPDTLFGFASGNVQKLENNNYLITTVGSGATSLEIKPTTSDSGEIVWQSNYNLTLPSGAAYRAHRVDGLHPIAFSIILDNFNLSDDNQPIYPICDNEENLVFRIWNDGDSNETFNYTINELFSGDYNINAGESREITYEGIIPGNILLSISPLHRQDLTKNIEIDVMNQCYDDGDINFDNLVDVSDILIIISYITQDNNFNFIQLQLANLNNDNYIDILDIIQIIQIILN